MLAYWWRSVARWWSVWWLAVVAALLSLSGFAAGVLYTAIGEDGTGLVFGLLGGVLLALTVLQVRDCLADWRARCR